MRKNETTEETEGREATQELPYASGRTVRKFWQSRMTKTNKQTKRDKWSWLLIVIIIVLHLFIYIYIISSNETKIITVKQ